MAATTISRATITDDSGSGTDGSVLNSAFFGTAIYDKVDALFTASVTVESANGMAIAIVSSHASAASFFDVYVTGTGDPHLRMRTSDAAWYLGVDNSDADKLKMSAQGIGTSDALVIDTANNVVLGTAALSTSATNGFLYIPSCAGAASGTPTTHTGRCPMVFDTSNNRLYIWNGSGWRYASTT